MKKIIFILAVVGCSLGLFSCKKNFLEVEDTQNLYRQSYVHDLATLQDFMNGNYIRLSGFIEDGNAAAYPELVADNLKPFSATSASRMLPYYNWAQISDAATFTDFIGTSSSVKSMDPYWALGYRTTRACSFVIEEMAKYRDENPAKADDIKGQALAIRAYIYFKLVNTFAQPYGYSAGASHLGVPYITNSDITKPYSRQTVAEVYTAMIADLNEAIPLLPGTVTDTRYMNRTAAKALLARIYLFKEDYANAKSLATEIANQVPLMTVAGGYPNSIFTLRAPAQTESLFQLSPRSSGYTTNFMGKLFVSPINFVATNDLAVILRENPNDARYAWVSATAPWNVRKFPTGVAPEVTPAVTPASIAYYPPIIRSSEMFLTVAEASAKTGDENTSRTFLNAVRRRADPAIALVTATGPALLDSVYKERRKELCFESLRMYDLQRWKLGVNRIDALSASTPKVLAYPNDKAIAPIPIADVRLAGLVPNPGY